MKFIDFWAFQNFIEMLSHDKILFNMLFGAFHITPRIIIKLIRPVLLRATVNFDPYMYGLHVKRGQPGKKQK